jgi:hypothetical protein
MRKLKLAVPTKKAMFAGEMRPRSDSKQARIDFAAKQKAGAANKKAANE